jgi:hypothetical protein
MNGADSFGSPPLHAYHRHPRPKVKAKAKRELNPKTM